MPVETFVVKGSYYYQAARELGAKRLVSGVAVTLQRHPSNPHDCNAVRVLLAENGAHLGHVPRTMSATVSAQVLAGVVGKAYIQSVSKWSSYIEIKVTYFFEGLPQPGSAPSNTVASTHRPFRAPRSAAHPAPSSLRRPSQTLKIATAENEGLDCSRKSMSRRSNGVRWGRVILVVCALILLILVIFL